MDSVPWGMRPLGEVGVRVLDCAHKTPADAGSGFPYLAIPNIRDGRVNLDSFRRISEQDFRAWTARHPPLAGDVVVTRRGRVGDTAPLPDGLACAIGQNLVLLRSDEKEVDQAYLRWACRGPMWRQEVERLLNVGAVFDSLNVSDIPKMRIPVPPLPEQSRIAGVLGALDDLIATNRTLMANLDELAMALFRATWDRESWIPIGELGEVTMGQSPPGSTYNEVGDGLVFYQGVRDYGDRYPTPRIYCSEPSRTATAGDILIAVRAPIGDTNVAIEPTAFGRGLAALRARHPAIALRALRASLKTWSSHEGTGTVFSSISGPDLRAALVPSVPDPALDDRLQVLDDMHRALAEEIAQLEAARDELLPLLMSGRVRVKDVAA